MIGEETEEGQIDIGRWVWGLDGGKCMESGTNNRRSAGVCNIHEGSHVRKWTPSMVMQICKWEILNWQTRYCILSGINNLPFQICVGSNVSQI